MLCPLCKHRRNPLIPERNEFTPHNSLNKDLASGNLCHYLSMAIFIKYMPSWSLSLFPIFLERTLWNLTIRIDKTSNILWLNESHYHGMNRREATCLRVTNHHWMEDWRAKKVQISGIKFYAPFVVTIKQVVIASIDFQIPDWSLHDNMIVTKLNMVWEIKSRIECKTHSLWYFSENLNKNDRSQFHLYVFLQKHWMFECITHFLLMGRTAGGTKLQKNKGQ